MTEARISVRARRRITRVAIAISFLNLATVVAVPQYRHHLPGGGWASVILAVAGILGGLAYLSSTGSRS